MRKTLIALLLVFAALFTVSAQAQNESLSVAMDIAKGDTLVLNPYTASDSASVVILQNLYEGLFSYDPETGKPVRAIAESYFVSEDGLTWTFKLREAMFSDRSPINARSFIKSWNYLLQGPLASNLSFLRSMNAPDSDTLVLTLRYPVSYLPSLLCQPCLAAVKPDDNTVFSGAYKLASSDGRNLELRANPYYWDKVGCKKVNIIVGTEDDDFSAAFLDGDIQWSLSAVEGASDYLVAAPLYGTTFLYFSSSSEYYSNPDVQRALARLIPVEYIRQVQSTLFPSSSLVPESGAEAVYEGTISDDLSRALAELNVQSLADFPELHIAVHRGDSTILSGELIQEIWSATLHSTVSLDTVPSTVYTTDPDSNPYDFCIITWIADYFDPGAFLRLFRSDASYNIANYRNPEYDALLDLADTADDRNSYLLQAEQILLDNGTVIPLSTAVSVNFVRNDLIEGWYPNLLDIHPLKYIRFK